MGPKGVLLFCVISIFSLMLLTATVSGLSNMFSKVYADDNCDATTLCINIPGSNTQRNNCNRGVGFTVCGNSEVGGVNNQNNNCVRSSCDNLAAGDLNNQNNNCRNSVACFNEVINGNSNSQNLNCRASSCINAASDGNSNSQNTACVSSICKNSGQDTNLYSNSATSGCVSGGPDTTTICQKDRTFTFPNH